MSNVVHEESQSDPRVEAARMYDMYCSRCGFSAMGFKAPRHPRWLQNHFLEADGPISRNKYPAQYPQCRFLFHCRRIDQLLCQVLALLWLQLTMYLMPKDLLPKEITGIKSLYPHQNDDNGEVDRDWDKVSGVPAEPAAFGGTARPFVWVQSQVRSTCVCSTFGCSCKGPPKRLRHRSR